MYLTIRKHIDIIEHAQQRLAGRAEVHGAIQQEVRVSRAVDVMIRHVENLKRDYEREHLELREMRRLVTESRGSGSSVFGDASPFGKNGAAGAGARVSVVIHNVQYSGLGVVYVQFS